MEKVNFKELFNVLVSKENIIAYTGEKAICNQIAGDIRKKTGLPVFVLPKTRRKRQRHLIQ